MSAKGERTTEVNFLQRGGLLLLLLFKTLLGIGRIMEIKTFLEGEQ